MLCALTLQNDPDGILIAIETAEDIALNEDPSTLEVPIIRNPGGEVIDLILDKLQLGRGPLAEFSRDVALLGDPTHRIVLLEAACLCLIQQGRNELTELRAAAAVMRRTGVGLDALDYPRGMHEPVSNAELIAAVVA